VGKLVVGQAKIFVKEGPELRDGCSLSGGLSQGVQCDLQARVCKGQGWQWVGGQKQLDREVGLLLRWNWGPVKQTGAKGRYTWVP